MMNNLNIGKNNNIRKSTETQKVLKTHDSVNTIFLVNNEKNTYWSLYYSETGE